ncbi:MAG: kelch repeat-containing protein [bacterium]
MKLKKLLMLFSVIFIMLACTTENYGSIQLDLAVPYYHYDNSPPFYCDSLSMISKPNCRNMAILPTDRIFITVYTKQNVSDGYTYDYQPTPFVVSDFNGSEEFMESMINGNYYKFQVIVKNENEKPKMTGIIKDIQYDADKNISVTVPLGVVGDFTKIFKNNSGTNNALKTYISEKGSAGSAATALSNGEILLSGGWLKSFDPEQEYITPRAEIINIPGMKKRGAPGFQRALMDHKMATVHDGSERGLVVVAYGKMPNDVYSNSILIYNPDNSFSTEIDQGDPGAHANATAVKGGGTSGVFVTGGCGDGNASDKVYWITPDKSQPSGVNTQLTNLNTARCHHAVADISYYDDEEVFHPQIMVLGGVKAKEINSNYVMGADFAEIITVENGVPKVSTLSLDLEDDFHLVSASADRVIWDSGEEWQQKEGAVILAGGFADTNLETSDDGLRANRNVFMFYNKNNSWEIQRNNIGLTCPFSSMTRVKSRGTSKKTVAMNCGTPFNDGNLDSLYEYDDRLNEPSEAGVYLLGTTYSSQSGLSVSINESMFPGNVADSENEIVDGPAVTDLDGQAFLFGTQNIFFVSGYAF